MAHDQGQDGARVAPGAHRPYNFAPGEAESMVSDLRLRARTAEDLRARAAQDGVTPEERRALRRRAADEAESSERTLMLLFRRAQGILERRAARSFRTGTPGWEVMREEAVAEMAAEFARRVPSADPTDRHFAEKFQSAVYYLALRAVGTVWANNGRDPRTGKPRLHEESLDAPVKGTDELGDAGGSRHDVEGGTDADDLWRAASADDLRAVLLTEMEARLRSKDTVKQRAIARRRIEAFCLRLAELPYERIAGVLGVDPRTERSDVEAAGDALAEVVPALLAEGIDLNAEEVIAVLSDFGREIEREANKRATDTANALAVRKGTSEAEEK